MRWILLVAVMLGATVSAPGGEDASSWYVEVKRAAKYARMSITATADLARLDREEQAAKGQLAKAPALALPPEGRATCQGAAQAVVDFIKAARAGNMSSGPASFQMQYARWDRLSEDCLTAIQRSGRS